MYVGFMDLEKAYERSKREALGKVLRMYIMGCKLLNRVKSMYVHNLSSVRVKRG